MAQLPEVLTPAGDASAMSASPPAAEAWSPFSPEEPRPDPGHEARAVRAIARAVRDIPFYKKRGDVAPPAEAPLGTVLARLPLLLKKDVRATLNKHWVPAGRDVRADLESGALQLVETSGSTGERMRIL